MSKNTVEAVNFVRKTKLYPEKEDTESSDFDKIEYELPNREEQRDEQRNNENANAMPRPYNLRRTDDDRIVMEFLSWISERIS